MTDNRSPETMSNEMTREQFIAYLVKAGWHKDEAEAEWSFIQNGDESGNDRPAMSENGQ